MGSGPGDPELMTLRGKRVLEDAEVVLFDRLIGSEILDWAPKSAEMIDVGKLPGRHKLTQEEINNTLAEKALEGKRVVRLKGGDPYVFGRGGEEGLHLVKRGVPFEVVPGVTSAISVPAHAGIPITHRGISTSATIVTGHEEPGKAKNLDWSALAKLGGTLVVLMGVSRLEQNVAALLENGKDPKTPAALIEKGWSSEERLVTSTLENIVEVAKTANVESPAILVAGEVVNLAEDLGQKTVAILRPDNRSEESERLAIELGFKPLIAPTITFEKIPLPEDLSSRIEDAECVVFTSATGVEIALEDEKVKPALKNATLATIGPRTKEALNDLGLDVSVVPEKFSSAGLIKALSSRFKKVLLLRSAQGSPELVEGLKNANVEVNEVQLYDVTPSFDPRLDWLIRKGAPYAFAFTSGSTARYLIDRASYLGLETELREKLARAKIAAIGPPTRAELERLGVRVDVMPERHTFQAMLEVLRSY